MKPETFQLDMALPPRFQVSANGRVIDSLPYCADAIRRADKEVISGASFACVDDVTIDQWQTVYEIHGKRREWMTRSGRFGRSEGSDA